MAWVVSNPGLSIILKKPAIRRLDPVTEIDPCLPSHVAKPRDVHQLSRRTIGLARITSDISPKAGDLRNDLRQLEDAHIRSRPHVDVAEHGLGGGVVSRMVEVHEEERRLRHVFDVEELS